MFLKRRRMEKVNKTITRALIEQVEEEFRKEHGRDPDQRDENEMTERYHIARARLLNHIEQLANDLPA